MDDVCVIVAALNARSTVARAVASALAEPEVREVVVIDDASNDATAAEAQRSDDGTGRLKVLRSPVNLGPAAARNLALAHSSAPLVAVLDADDLILPGRFTTLADPGGDWDISADNIMFVPAQAAPDYAELTAFPTGGMAERMTFVRYVQANIPYPGRPRGELASLKPVMRRAFLDRHGLAYDARLRVGEDFDLYARMLLAGARFRLVAACGYVGLDQPDSLSAQPSADDLAALIAADDRMLARSLRSAEMDVLTEHRNQYAQRWHHRHFLNAKRRSGLVRALFDHRARPRLLFDAGVSMARDKLSGARGNGSGGQIIHPGHPRFLVRP